MMDPELLKRICDVTPQFNGGDMTEPLKDSKRIHLHVGLDGLWNELPTTTGHTLIDYQEEIAGQIREQDWQFRQTYVKNYGWFVLTRQSAETLAAWLRGRGPVLEVCSGRGQMAYHLQELGVKPYTALDTMSWRYEPLTPTRRGNIGDVTVRKYGVVLIAWPPYGSPVAYKLLQQMRRGQYLVYQGEMWGCTATDEFHWRLDRDYKRLENISAALNRTHVRFSGMRDEWHVYRKVRGRK